MKFYDRKNELKFLENKINSDLKEFIYISGRRRIGKTSLIKRVIKDKKSLYFFVGRVYKNELLKRFSEKLSQEIGIPLKIEKFYDFFKILFQFSDKFDVIVFDEFQNFYYVEKSVFSYIQEFFDETKKIKLFVSGSHYTLLKEIFEKYSNPLYGRKTGQIFLNAFDYKTQIEILKQEYKKEFSGIDFLTLYGIYSGIPYYLEYLVDREFSKKGKLKDILLNAFFDKENIFLNEVKSILILEFGNSYQIYFSILSAIANSKYTRGEIADFVGINSDSLGIYLQNLEKNYDLIYKEFSINAKKTSKKIRYKIKDNFFDFWFRYIYKKQELVELGMFDELVSFVKQDLNVFLGFKFEKLVKEFLIFNNGKNNLCNFKFTNIGNYFDNKREIDLVCENKEEQKVLFIELKISYYKDKQKILQDLKTKVDEINIWKNYKKDYKVLSLDEFFEIVII